MSTRNKLRVVLGIVSKLTADVVVRDVREILKEMTKPESDAVFAFQDVTVAEVKQTFGDWQTNPIVIENLIRGYCGRLIQQACSQQGLSIAELSPIQIGKLLDSTDAVENVALRRMTMN